MQQHRDAPDIVVLPPVLVGGTMLVGVAVHYLVWPINILPMLLSRVLGLVLFVSSGILAHRAHRAMERVGTNIYPTQPTLALATDGPFHFTRNPLYIAAIGVYIAVTLWVNSLVMLLLLVPMTVVLHQGIVLREERYLETKFPSEYNEYRSRVKRWL
ncbi:MAG TPA: isoprenylcysteine carboxylmethyltransferase family protein [Gemmatimonadaceae bacterium]|nr:isoprenylcysteine carboxylmethyltransferase family protein [Gemmatimonadaceae bacterium]